MKKPSNSPLGVAAKQGNMFNDKRQSYQHGITAKKTPLDIVSPTQTKMGELDDDENDDDVNEDENDEDNSQSRRLEESKDDENVRDEDG